MTMPLVRSVILLSMSSGSMVWLSSTSQKMGTAPACTTANEDAMNE